MYCWKCGTKLDDNARFCSTCGTRLDEDLPVADPNAMPEQPVEGYSKSGKLKGTIYPTHKVD